MNLEELVSALENDTNVNVIDTNSKKIKKTINDNLQRLQIDRNILKTYNKLLKNYIYIETINDIKIGHSIKYINIEDPEKLLLSANYIVCNINVNNNGILITLKTYKNRYFTIYFHKYLIFKKMSHEERLIIKALDYINN
tara:strand:- start:4916 stop:5335 length:420 start_codon:yes stop_codon:yes gene_type:complete